MVNELPTVTGSDRPVDAPLMLELRYLITAHPPNGETVDTSDTLEQHRMLSTAVRILREHAVVRPPDLEGSLTGGPPLRLTIDAGATE